MAETIASKIESIIAKRKPLAAAADRLLQRLNDLERTLLDYGQFLKMGLQKLAVDTPPLNDRIAELESQRTQLLEASSVARQRLAQIRSRFSRDTINIGVVGLARMGKGTLLKSLTGLDDDVIPTGGKDHCTGATSVISNSSGSFRAIIECHTEQSFLDDVIRPFCNCLHLDAPRTLAEFRSLTIPALSANHSEISAHDKQVLARLRDFHLNLAQYADLLGRPPITITRPEDIRQYVAQDDAGGNRVHHKWMAVKQARIDSVFPIPDLGRLALADTPGLGDFISGAEDRLLAAVGQNLDLVAFVHAPDANNTVLKPELVAVYDLVRNSIPEIGLNKWAFFVANKIKTERLNNEHNVPDFLQKLDGSAVSVAKTCAINCGDKEQSKSLLQEMVSFLTTHLSQLDQEYANCIQSRLDDIRMLATHLCDASLRLLPDSTISRDFPLFQRKFEETWGNLQEQLQRYLAEAASQRHSADNDLGTAISKVLETLPTVAQAPSAEEFERRAVKETKQIAHAHCMSEIRARVSRAFLTLDESLRRSCDALRQKVRAILVSDDGGRLARMIDTDGQDWWDSLAAKWPAGSEQHELIQLLQDFELSYRGFIQHRVRKHLDGLDADRIPDDLRFRNEDSPAKLAEKIRLCLESTQEAIKQDLTKISYEPTEARFAILEEFVDRLTRPAQSKQDWMCFYESRCGAVWPEAFKELRDRADIVQEWQHLVSRVNNFSQPGELSLAACS
jgi:hypothetical protein